VIGVTYAAVSMKTQDCYVCRMAICSKALFFYVCRSLPANYETGPTPGPCLARVRTTRAPAGGSGGDARLGQDPEKRNDIELL